MMGSFKLFIVLAVLGFVLTNGEEDFSIKDFQITVTNTENSKDVKRVNVEYPRSSDNVVSVGKTNKFLVEFTGQALKAKKSPKNKLAGQLHQTFLRIVDHKSGNEFIASSKLVSGKQTIQFNVGDLIFDLQNKSGVYNVELLIGDSSLKQTVVWKVTKINVDFTGLEYTREHLFVAKPEIRHKFRVAEKRPPTTVSSAFTLAVLAPFLVLLGGWGYVGANLRQFPLGADFFYAVGFHASLGAVLLLFVLYWFALNMLDTLVYLLVLSVPSAYFAHGLLNSLARRHKTVKQD